MKKCLCFLFALIFVLSCNKDNTETPLPFSNQSYKMIVTLNWKSPEFSVPASAHVTALNGMVHSKDSFMWNTGILATSGLENVAEDGNNLVMNQNLDTIIARHKALSRFLFAQPAITGSVTDTLLVNTNYSYISFASMIAPSPDWFMGIHDYNLVQNNKWIIDATLPLFVYDAGTEDGDVFGYSNPATVPQQAISLLTAANATVLANGNASVAPIGTVRFLRITP